MPKKTAHKLLTDKEVLSLKPKAKDYKVADAHGLFLLVKKSGAKCWRFKYRFNGKEKLLALGVYPEVRLTDARELLAEHKKSLKQNIDPALTRRINGSGKGTPENSFEAIGREWYKKQLPDWDPVHAKKVIQRVERDIFPWLGNRPIENITPAEVLSVLERIESRGAIDTAHRALGHCGQIFRYARAIDKLKVDPSADLSEALTAAQTKHRATITKPEGIGALLRAIKGYEGNLVTKCALELSPLLFVRPGELQNAEWSEFDFKEKEWRIPGAKMKERTMHIVPLSRQSLHILKELHPMTGKGRYVFPSILSNERPMSDNTVNSALRRLAYEKEEITAHGFRSMASTVLNERGWHKDVIERQLAHVERDSVRDAYNHAEYLSERRLMMQYWADYLDALKNNTEPPKKVRFAAQITMVDSAEE